MVNDAFQLMKLRRKEVIRIFRELPPPALREMHGEFRATLLDQGRWLHNFLTVLAFNFPGAWISKSFTPLSDQHGCGYNTFRVGNKTKKIYRMKTRIDRSNVDDKASFHLDYQAVIDQERMPSVTKLTGEIRKLAPSMYLGVGTADFGIKRLRRQQPFLLEGPVSDFDDSVWKAYQAAA